MFKWNFLLPKWNSLIPILPIKLIPFLHAIIFQTGFRICYGFLDIRLVIAVSDRWKRDRSRWWFFRNFIEDFLTFTLLVISLVPTWTMRSSGFSLIMSSGFSRIFPLVPPEKFTVFTSWLTLRPFSEIPFTMESPVNTIFFFPTQGFCLSFPFLELGLEFAFSVCNVSSFAVTASKFAELVLLLYYYY